jgi:hypothetical protein
VSCHGEYAVGFVERIGTWANGLWRRAIAEHAECLDVEVPPYSALLALAWEELTCQGVTADPDKTVAPVVDVGIVYNENDPDMATSRDGDIRLPIEHLAHLLCDARHDRQGRRCPVEHGSHRPICHPSPTAGPQHPRRRLCVPRLRPARQLVRRPPRHPLRTRWQHRPREPRPVVSPPRRHQPSITKINPATWRFTSVEATCRVSYRRTMATRPLDLGPSPDRSFYGCQAMTSWGVRTQRSMLHRIVPSTQSPRLGLLACCELL